MMGFVILDKERSNLKWRAEKCAIAFRGRYSLLKQLCFFNSEIPLSYTVRYSRVKSSILILRIGMNKRKDKSVIIQQILSRNICVDNIVKFSLPQTWDSNKQQPRERVLSFLASITNTHISIFLFQVFRRNLIEISMVTDPDGNSKNDRYRASKMKVNEEYVITSSMDIGQLVNRLFKKYENDITPEELDYYRKHLKPSRLQQLMIEIYFFNYTSSSSEFSLLKNLDWYKLLLVMRNDIMKRFGISRSMILDSTLVLILTANIEESPVGEKVYVKDTKFLDKDPLYNTLATKYYSTMIDMNPEIIKKLLITFANSKYRFVLYEEPGILDQEITVNKRELMVALLNFLVLANTSISLENMVEE